MSKSVPLTPEMPDCRTCKELDNCENDELWQDTPHYSFINCTNGNKYNPAEKIQLYTITEEK